jgi:hypothetical protein
MKRFIPLIAVAIAMAVPLTISAQTPDYYGYENSDLPTLISWIEDGINAGFVTFDTQQHEDDFLALAATLHSTVDVGQCQAICGMLKQAAANIVATSHREMADWLCEIAGWAYTDESPLLLTPNQVEDMQATFNQPGSGEPLRHRHKEVKHLESDFEPPCGCKMWRDWLGRWHHCGACDKCKIVWYD